MRNEHISDALNMVNDDIIEEADAVRHRKQKHGKGWCKWAGVAACFAIIIYAAIWQLPQKKSDDLTQLPMLHISEDTSSAMGFEGYLAYDVSELVNANPWNDNTELATLPVYENLLDYDEYFIAKGANLDEMREFLLEVASRLGLNTDTLTITDDVPDEEMQKKITEEFQARGDTLPDGYFNPKILMAEENGLKIEVDQAMTTAINFEPAVSLPSEYHFAYDATYEDMAAVAEYLGAEYKDLIGIEQPQVNITGGDYTYDLHQGYTICFFDTSGSKTEQILNYNFNQVAFYPDGEGKLFLARIYHPDLSKKVGDYPIITSEEATKRLSEGHFITTVPYEMPGVEHVRKVELIYRTGVFEEYYMPYYRFYIEIPELEENGLKTYGGYYVPAVEETYISNMPMWGESFH